MTLPILPPTLDVVVNGAVQTITGKPNKEQTRVWFNGSRVVEQFTDDAASALGKVTVQYDGADLKAGVPHTSEPQRYRAGHKLAGQAKPNTGGNWTVTHSAVIDLADLHTGDKHRFTLMVTVTYVAEKGFVVSAKAIPQGTRKGDPLVGEDLAFV